MKMFRVAPPIRFKGDEVELNDLAKNHNYKEEGKYLVVEGKNQELDLAYKAFYNKEGEFLCVKFLKKERTKALVSWKQEYEMNAVETIDKNGNRLIVHSRYLTTEKVTNKLIGKIFISTINGEECKKTFFMEDKNKWLSRGNFDERHFRYWIKKSLP